MSIIVVLPNHIRKFMKPMSDLVPNTLPIKSIGLLMTPPINPKDVSQKMESTITPINPKEPFTRYKYPSFDLLKEYEVNINHINEEEQRTNKNRIIEVLGNFGIQIKTIHASVGPAISFFELRLYQDCLQTADFL